MFELNEKEVKYSSNVWDN